MDAELPLHAAQEAWQSALGQLQLEMSKASFDTWVQDTRIISLQNGEFLIGASNAYARDWLESRLTSTVSRLLTGILNEPVKVQFVVAPGAIPEDETNDAEGSEDDLTPDQVEIAPVYDLLYDEIVQPEHVTLVSRYFLRHLRVIGPELGWLYLGFRQAAFNAGGRQGSKHARFSGQAIAALSGITERTFWNRIGNPETWQRLHGLVDTELGSPGWNTASGTPRRLPRRYTVAMSLPLTAADAHSLRTWLSRNVERFGGPEQVIEAASRMPLDELLPLDGQVREGDRVESVSAILADLFGGQIPPERMAGLATRLHKAIMPDNDRLGVTHFFVEHILPHLGIGPGWMLTILRDRCYYNQETGEARTRVRIAGGYAEIAGWLGLLRPKTVWEWLRNPIVQVYLRCESSELTGDKWTAPRLFEVLLNEVPDEILQAVIGQTEWRDFQYRGGANFSIGVARFSESSGANFSIAVARISQFGGAIFRVFKSLNHLNPITNDSTPQPPANTAEGNPIQKLQPARGVGGELPCWDFDSLARNNHLARAGELRRKHAETGATSVQLAQQFVSWLLYAFSPAGTRITDPVSLAARRLIENISAGAGGDFDLLAQLHPFELKALFDQDLAGELWQADESTIKEIYTLNFHNLEAPHKRELYRHLFGNQRSKP